jgi:hypothetical protein
MSRREKILIELRGLKLILCEATNHNDQNHSMLEYCALTQLHVINNHDQTKHPAYD